MSEQGFSNPVEEMLQAQLITSMRIYDVLMSILANQNDGVARKLEVLHRDGKLLFTSPYFDGTFVAEQ